MWAEGIALLPVGRIAAAVGIVVVVGIVVAVVAENVSDQVY